MTKVQELNINMPAILYSIASNREVIDKDRSLKTMYEKLPESIINFVNTWTKGRNGLIAIELYKIIIIILMITASGVEVRDREKVMRGLKRKYTTILTGYQIYHNYIREHQGLNNKTPAEASGIKIEGENKWLTLIQNAKLKTN